MSVYVIILFLCVAVHLDAIGPCESFRSRADGGTS